MPMKPCFGYTRVSTVKQGDGASLAAQKDAILAFASQNNLTVAKWFEERETASKTGRPVFGEMMNALASGAAEGLILHKVDRTARNFADWSRLHDIAKLGVKVFFAADSLDFGTRGGQLLADIQMALAADYSRNLSLEVKKGIYGRIKNGLYPFRAPIGYLDTGGGSLKAVDPAKAPLVKKLFQLYATGDYSIDSLLDEMKCRGLTGAAGRPVVRRNIETILRNPFYCGKMRVRGKLYPGSHEALVPTAQFRRVQAIKSARHGKKSTKHGHLFQGLFRCRRCGGTLTGECQKQNVYYRCHTKQCPEKTIREDRLDAEVVEKLRELQISEDDRGEISDGIQSWLSNNGNEEIEKSLRLRISDAKSRQDRLTDLLVDGAIDREAFSLRKENTEFELQQLREELAVVENNRAQQEDFDHLLDLATNLADLFSVAPPAGKRRLIRNCLEYRKILGGCIQADAAEWLTELPKYTGSPCREPRTIAACEIARAARELEIIG